MSLNNKIYIIAEIGINHNGSLKIAKQLIDIAKVAGCDVVKFQKRNPDVCVPEHQKTILRDTPWGRMTYLDYKQPRCTRTGHKRINSAQNMTLSRESPNPTRESISCTQNHRQRGGTRKLEGNPLCLYAILRKFWGELLYSVLCLQ